MKRDLGPAVREFLHRLDAAAPLPPPYSEISENAAHEPDRRRRRTTTYGLAAALIAVVAGGVVMVSLASDHDRRGETVPDGSDRPGESHSAPDGRRMSVAGRGQERVPPSAPVAGDDRPRAIDGRGEREYPEVNGDPVVSPRQYYRAGGMTVSERKEAVDAEIARCMAAAGFEYEARDFPPSEPLTRNALREWRERWGYGAPTSEPALAAGGTSNRDALDPDYRRALSGTPGGEPGCVELARAALVERHPGLADVFGLALDSSERAREPRQTDRQLAEEREAMAAYAQCMAAAGYRSIDSPGEARSRVLDRRHTPGRAIAVPLAIQDLECQQAHLWPTYARTQVAYIDRH